MGERRFCSFRVTLSEPFDADGAASIAALVRDRIYGVVDVAFDDERALSAANARAEALATRITTIADEANGPHAVQSADDALSCIERALFEERARAEAAEARAMDAERLRESDSRSLEWTWGEVRKVAEALGLDGKATVPQVVERARDHVRSGAAWAAKCKELGDAFAALRDQATTTRAAAILECVAVANDIAAQYRAQEHGGRLHDARAAIAEYVGEQIRERLAEKGTG